MAGSDRLTTSSHEGQKPAIRPTQPKLRFNPFSPAFRENPYATYQRLREQSPIQRIMGSWLLSRYEDVVGVLKDRRFSSSRIPHLVRRGRSGAQQANAYLDYGGIESFIAKAIVFTENPDHSRLRRLVGPVFSTAAMEAERPRLERIVGDLLKQHRAAGEMDLIDDFADKIPMHLVCERLGVSREIGPMLRDCAHEARYLLDPTLMSKADFIRVENTVQKAFSYLLDVVEERTRRPKDDVVSALLASRDRDDRLSAEEVAITCFMTFVAGHETTKHLIGNAALALLCNPHEAHRLRIDQRLVDDAINEVLRYDAPLQQTKRVAVEDCVFGGQRFREGEQLLLLIGSANRDPEVFEDPNRFDITRDNAKQHLALGHGMRNCLGGTMAHLEAATACRFLFCHDIIPQLAGGDELEWQSESIILRGLCRLPVTFVSAN